MNDINSQPKISFDKNELIIMGYEKTLIKLPARIEQIEQFNDVVIVRVHPKGEIFINENIFAVSHTGKLLWQIKVVKHVTKHSPYTGMVKKESLLKVHNWDGTDLVIDPNSGKIIDESYSK